MAGKKYKEVLKKVDPKKAYTVEEAVKLTKELVTTKFDPSVDIAIKLALDTTQADQQLRAAVSLPHGNGRSIKVLAICEGADVDAATAAGADFAGGKEMIEKIKGGWMDFDVIITGPKFMLELGKLGKQLGPKGLMPNPKTGTVTQDIGKTVQEFKRGKQEYRTDKDGNVHLTVGKASFSDKQIVENVNAFIQVIKAKKPASVKGNYFQNISISASMSPGVKIQIPALD